MHHFSFRSAVALVVMGVCATSSVHAQTALERLEKLLGGDSQTQPAPEKGEKLPPPPPVRETERPQAKSPGYLGANCDDAGANGQGVVVLSVREGGPAEVSGVRPGDRIVRVNQQAIANIDEFARTLAPLNAGSKLALEVSRNGKRETLAVTLGAKPEANANAPEIAGELSPRAMLGVHAVDVTEAARERYKLTVRRGALIESLVPGSPADRFGLPLGGVVVSVNGERVDTADDLRHMIAGANPGDEIELGYYQGAELQRKRVRLVPAGPLAAPVDAPAPPSPPRLGLRGNGDDRPVLRALERALQGGGIGGGEAPREVTAAAELEALRAEVNMLRQENADLQRRLRVLERQLPQK